VSSQISRRQFLKLLPLLSMPLVRIKWPYAIEEESNSFQNQDASNILILVLDTLSAKHVSLYGYNRETTPNLARFAQSAAIYHSHYAGGNFTSPGTASLFTGTYPWSHRSLHQGGTVDASYEKRNVFSLVPDHYYKTAYTHNIWVSLLLHQFRGDLDLWKKTQDLCLNDGELYDQVFPNDYDVACLSETTSLVSGRGTPESSSLFLSWVLHRARRITTMKTLTREYSQLFPRGIPASWTYFFLLEVAIDWLKDQMNSYPQPFLGYYHFMPPHSPYAARRDFIDAFKDGWKPVTKKSHFFSQGVPDQLLNRRRREYDEYIAYTDAEFGRLFDFMAQSGLLDNTYVIVTSDHGELFERGIRGHTTQTLYEPLIRIPLLISKPGQGRREDVHTLTSCVDLLPTLLDVTGQPIPDWCEGRILPTFGDQEAGSDRAIFAVEAKSNPKQAPLTKATVAIIKDQYKLIHYFGYDKYESEYELYDLANDPEELEDLYASEKQVAANLQNELRDKLQEVNQPYV
jgi:arylsulfatase A-like enzyme